MNIIETLENVLPVLTGKQHTIAQYMIENPNEMCYIQLKDFSKKIGCTEATSIRFCKKLGFNSFGDVKLAFRSLRAENDFHENISQTFDITDLDSSISHNDYVMQQIENERQHFITATANIPYDDLDQAASKIADANVVYIIGRGLSQDMADFLRRRLALLGIECYAINPEDITSLQPAFKNQSKRRVFVFLTFPNYYMPIVNIARYVKEQGSYVIGFTDTTESRLTKYCDKNILLGKIEPGFFYSYSVLMTYFNILVAMVRIKAEDSQTKEFKNILEEISHPSLQDTDINQVLK